MSRSTSTRPNNCGECGRQCDLQCFNCVDGECVADPCEAQYFNLDGSDENGCEYGPCDIDPMGETCDGIDNDCDGQIDEGFSDLEDVPDDAFQDANCDGIDGDVSQSVFVSPGGDDDNSGLTPASPVATLTRAMRLAAARPDRNRVLVQSGLYQSENTISLVSGVSLHGGYGAGFSVRDRQRATIQVDASTGVQAVNLTEATLVEYIDMTVGDRGQPSQAAIGLAVSDSALFLTLRSAHIAAGRGGDGTNGLRGRDSNQASRGADANGNRGGAGGQLGEVRATRRERNTGPAGTPGAGIRQWRRGSAADRLDSDAMMAPSAGQWERWMPACRSSRRSSRRFGL